MWRRYGVFLASGEGIDVGLSGKEFILKISGLNVRYMPICFRSGESQAGGHSMLSPKRGLPPLRE